MMLNRNQCLECSLCDNPGPLMDTCRSADVMVVGLSAKVAKYENEIPLDGRTRSGRVIDELERIANEQGLTVYRTNIVKCAPLDAQKKLRYPQNAEMDACLGNFEEEIKMISPQVVILLGDIVRKTVMKKWRLDIPKPEDNQIHIITFDGKYIAAVYHPSYVLRSNERKQNYIEALKQIITYTKERM